MPRDGLLSRAEVSLLLDKTFFSIQFLVLKLLERARWAETCAGFDRTGIKAQKHQSLWLLLHLKFLLVPGVLSGNRSRVSTEPQIHEVSDLLLVFGPPAGLETGCTIETQTYCPTPTFTDWRYFMFGMVV